MNPNRFKILSRKVFSSPGWIWCHLSVVPFKGELRLGLTWVDTEVIIGGALGPNMTTTRWICDHICAYMCPEIDFIHQSPDTFHWLGGGV